MAIVVDYWTMNMRKEDDSMQLTNRPYNVVKYLVSLQDSRQLAKFLGSKKNK